VVLIKIVIIYHSKTGNTEKIAKAIHSELEREGAILKKVDEVTVSELTDADMVVFGSPVHFKSIPIKLLSVIKKVPDRIQWKVAWFYTFSIPDPDFHAGYEKRIQKFIDEYKLELLGIFKCLGEFKEEQLVNKVLTLRLSSKQQDLGERTLTESKGHPDDSEIEQAKRFALEILRKIQFTSHKKYGQI